MRVGIASDIHANSLALEKLRNRVLMRRAGIDRWWVLGDSVGYGPNPLPVLEWLLSDAVAYWHVGNHDLAYARWNVGAHGATSLSLQKSARLTCVLHRAQMRATPELHQRFIDHIETQDDDGHLRHARPRVQHLNDLTLVTVHSTPAANNDRDWVQGAYLRPAVGATAGAAQLRAALEALQAYRQQDEQVVGLVGHSHVQFVASLDAQGCLRLHGFEYEQALDLKSLPRTVLINVGSVGKPHDGFAAVPFVALDTDAHTLTLHRQGYNSTSVASAYPDVEMLLTENDFNMLRMVYSVPTQQDLLREINEELRKLSGGISSGAKGAWSHSHLGKVYQYQRKQVTAIAEPDCDGT